MSWFSWVLADRVRVLGPDHPSAITARRNLGRALVAANKFDDAITALERAVGDYERARGNDHLDTLGAQEELAAAYRASGQSARRHPPLPALAGRRASASRAPGTPTPSTR